MNALTYVFLHTVAHESLFLSHNTYNYCFSRPLADCLSRRKKEPAENGRYKIRHLGNKNNLLPLAVGSCSLQVRAHMHAHVHALLPLLHSAWGSLSSFKLAKVDNGWQKVIFNLLMWYGRLLQLGSIEEEGKQRENVEQVGLN